MTKLATEWVRTSDPVIRSTARYCWTTAPAWDAPEAVVDLQSEGVLDLGSIPDVVGLTGRRLGAAECRVLQGRDVCSVRVLVPDSRGLDQNFHDVTLVDMGESSVSPAMAT